MIRGPLFAWTRRAVAVVFGSVFLWQVAERADPRGCEAVVHVTEDFVDVTVDGWAYRAGAWTGEPIVFPLRPGRHTLHMSRGGRALFEQGFELRPGEEVVLTAWDASRGPRPDPASLERHQVGEQVVQVLDRQQLREVLGHE
jgi:hypothetical protein